MRSEGLHPRPIRKMDIAVVKRGDDRDRHCRVSDEIVQCPTVSIVRTVVGGFQEVDRLPQGCGRAVLEAFVPQWAFGVGHQQYPGFSVLDQNPATCQVMVWAWQSPIPHQTWSVRKDCLSSFLDLTRVGVLMPVPRGQKLNPECSIA
jgi:hypothetical protein